MFLAITNETIPASLAPPGGQLGETARRYGRLLPLKFARAVPPLLYLDLLRRFLSLIATGAAIA